MTAATAERALLTAFEDRRERKREFLRDVAPHRIKALLKLHEIHDVTPKGAVSDSEKGEETRVRKENFKFSMARVPAGGELVWADNDEVKCKAIDPGSSHVEYQGKKLTLSRLTAKLKGWPSARGSVYWLYEDETLQERRERFEAAES